VNQAVAAITALLGDDLITTTGESLEAVVLAAARRLQGTVAVAESCTGGRIAARLTAVPGASDVFQHGIVAYADAAKELWLDVPARILAAHGAVSAARARAMVQGLLRRTGATWGLAVTGIAGPAGGSAAKPVGTVWLASGGPGGERVAHHLLGGGRQRIQDAAAAAGLDLLRRSIAPAARP
jgi:nicotinamide-nucleotide amidase